LSAEVIFATAKVSAGNVVALRFLEAAGLCVVDVNLTFTVDAASIRGQTSLPVRAARPDDRMAVEDVAGTAFRFTRFHLDGVMPATLANRIKRAWAGNYFAGGRGDAMLVAEDDKGICGFLQAIERDGDAVIDLIAVDKRSAGAGLGTAMVAALARRPLKSGRSPKRLIVGSQAANAQACRFYEKLGFRLEVAAYVLHHHGASTVYPSD
jgi:ribosomal protein S18 acetylase RimI-like enzyme